MVTRPVAPMAFLRELPRLAAAVSCASPLPLTFAVGGVRVDAGVDRSRWDAVDKAVFRLGWLPHLGVEDPLTVLELDVSFVDDVFGQGVP